LTAEPQMVTGAPGVRHCQQRYTVTCRLATSQNDTHGDVWLPSSRWNSISVMWMAEIMMM